MGPSGPSLPLGKAAFTKHLVPFSWSISGARTQRVSAPESQTKMEASPSTEEGDSGGIGTRTSVCGFPSPCSTCSQLKGLGWS